MPREPGFTRDLVELILGYGLILLVLWTPNFPQIILAPVALLVMVAVVLARRPSLEELGLSRRGLATSLWILPAAIVFAVASLLIAKRLGTLHTLYQGDFTHIAGYILWTLYQQFLIIDHAYQCTRLLHAATYARSCERIRRGEHRGRAVRGRAYAKSSADGRDAGLGSRVVHAVPALSKSLRPRFGPGVARAVFRGLRAGCDASSPQSRPGIFARNVAAKPVGSELRFSVSR